MSDDGSNLAGRIFIGVFGSVFLGIGLTVLISLWATPFSEFGSPPLFFRIMGSFISLAFVAFGAMFVFAAFSGKLISRGQKIGTSTSHPQNVGPAQYACPKCGASIDGGHNVSPRGDVKCPYCHGWFNVHGKLA